MSGEGRLCQFRSAVRWVWFVGVPVGISSCCIYQCSGSLLLMVEVRIVSLCLHPGMTLLGSRQCWVAHCWIVMRAGIKCHSRRPCLPRRMTPLPPRVAVLRRSPSQLISRSSYCIGYRFSCKKLNQRSSRASQFTLSAILCHISLACCMGCHKSLFQCHTKSVFIRIIVDISVVFGTRTTFSSSFMRASIPRISF
jgi:hypothetical protein